MKLNPFYLSNFISNKLFKKTLEDLLEVIYIDDIFDKSVPLLHIENPLLNISNVLLI